MEVKQFRTSGPGTPSTVFQSSESGRTSTNSMPLTEEQKSDILNRLKKTVLEKHINVANPSQDYATWATTVDEQARDLLRSNDEEFEKGIRKLLSLLGSSHTGFYRKNGAI